MNMSSICAALALSLAFVPLAHASHLVELINEPVEQIVIDRDFVATAPVTLVIFGGYQLPSFWQATSISITGPASSTNLLQPVWAFTPAPRGSWADQAIDPAEHIVGLEFGGIVIGSYDLFSQSIATMAGDSYHLSFLYTQDYPGPNGAKVTVDETLPQVEAESTTPEPATWAMMVIGFGLIGWARRRHQPRAALG